ncbi:hypothetical protein DD237_007533 [Peronospora effusa]|uniref:Reverse transcriptase domain-containing protein n=1 Tax=Peronospora effusa TaxID=542832 RepID=A0A3R7WUW8_9STRA|nr:hypothetical protein DD237_007533 [Peronospora effusa]
MLIYFEGLGVASSHHSFYPSTSWICRWPLHPPRFPTIPRPPVSRKEPWLGFGWRALTVVLHHFDFDPISCSSELVLFKGTLSFFRVGLRISPRGPFISGVVRSLHRIPPVYPRATTEHLRLTVPGDRERHHLLAFADDSTGLLHNLQHAPTFVTSVRRYSAAAWIRLNVIKTHLFPFSPLTLHVREEMESEGWDVAADSGSVRLLEFHVSTSLPTSSRFYCLIADMVLRCTLWRYRARTFLGRAFILRTIVLPLLLYTAAVTRVPFPFALQIKRLCKSFLYKKTISDTRQFKGPIANEWLYRPTSLCGLKLSDPVDSTAALHLCFLRDAMAALSVSQFVPRWFRPAFILFTDPLVMVAKDLTFFTCLFREEIRCRNRGSVSLSFGSAPFTWHKLVVTHFTHEKF